MQYKQKNNPSLIALILHLFNCILSRFRHSNLFKENRQRNANARVLGTAQADALQNITGSFELRSVDRNTSPNASDELVLSATGAYKITKSANLAHMLQYYLPKTSLPADRVSFNASRTARTSSETRAPNTAFAPRLVAY